MDNSLDEAKKLWEDETDNYLVKAATINFTEYPPEVQEIIKDEVKKRGLEGVAFDKPSVAKELSKNSFFVQSYVELFDGYITKYSCFSKIFIPLIMFFHTFFGALGVLIALGLRDVFFQEIEQEEQIIYKKKT